MAKQFIISADSTCDLSPEFLELYDIHSIPVTIHLGNESFPDGEGFTPEKIYKRYHTDGTLPQTAAPGFLQFYDFFSACTKQGFEVVHLDVSSDLSGTYNNARLAAAELDGVYIVDSRTLSLGIGLLAMDAAQCRDGGMSAAETVTRITSLTDKTDVSFLLNSLEFMWKGGRCSALTALGANILKLRPALEIRSGKLDVYKKYRGNNRSVFRQYILDRLADKDIRPEHVFFADSGEVDAEALSELEALVHELLPEAQIHRAQAGCTMSSHCGPGCIGLMFVRK